MNNHKKLTTSGVIVALVVILAFVFYWFEWRPTQIKKDCYQKSIVRHQDSLGILRDAGIEYDPTAPENRVGGDRIQAAADKVASLGIKIQDKFITYRSIPKRYEECLRKNGF